ncbi:MAG: hypothetical protein ACREJG_12055, partial [Candidatus Rokuibacteriota bacterium]
LLPGTLPATPVARLAAAMCAVLGGEDRARGLGAVESVVVRLPGQRIVVRPVETARRAVIVVTAAAIADRPALLHDHVERAAARLGAA